MKENQHEENPEHKSDQLNERLLRELRRRLTKRQVPPFREKNNHVRQSVN